MRYYNNDATVLSLPTPSTVFALLGAANTLLSLLVLFAARAIGTIHDPLILTLTQVTRLSQGATKISVILGALAAMCFVLAVITAVRRTDAQKICHMVRKSLYLPENGNPLQLRNGERLPKIKCQAVDDGKYIVTIGTAASTVDAIQAVTSSISAGFNRAKYKQYAVTVTNADVAYNYVQLTIDDVTVHHEIIADSVSDLLSDDPARLNVQHGTQIDLTTSGSILCAGKTRSGKTTGIISLLLQILSQGRDEYGSMVVIIDPKQAELSQLPHVATVDNDGEARAILSAMKRFANTITERQKTLNILSRQSGDAVHWWEAGMKVSVLFIDEFVSLRTLYPKKASKDDPDYCLASFDGLLKRIITMGASAGCYAIISIAEASVEEGGLPSMLKSAMSTRILFRPTVTEARLMWDSDRIKSMPPRVYTPGDAWFSSTDGTHDDVSFVHFPVMQFAVYGELGRLLSRYYDTTSHRPQSGAIAGGVNAKSS